MPTSQKPMNQRQDASTAADPGSPARTDPPTKIALAVAAMLSVSSITTSAQTVTFASSSKPGLQAFVDEATAKHQAETADSKSAAKKSAAKKTATKKSTTKKSEAKGASPKFNNYGKNFENYAKNFENYAKNFENYGRNFENPLINKRSGIHPSKLTQPTSTSLPNGSAIPETVELLLASARLRVAKS